MADALDAEFRRLAKVKAAKPRKTPTIGGEMVTFFRSQVEKPHQRMGKIAAAWMVLVPQSLQEHCSLEGYRSGTLTVIVDTSSHLFDFKQLLLAGLEKQLLLACRSSGLKKISLKRGQWYDRSPDGEARPRF